MKKRMLSLLCVLALCLGLLPVTALAEAVAAGPDWIYDPDAETLTWTDADAVETATLEHVTSDEAGNLTIGGSGSADFNGDLDLSGTIRDSEGNPYQITAIAADAFYNTVTLTSVNLSGCTSLKTIGDWAFVCDNDPNKPHSGSALISVDLSGCASLETIGNYAFAACDELSSVDLSGCTKLKSIGKQAFADCDKLSSVNLSGCASLETIGDSAFQSCGSLETADLSGCTGLKTIGDYAFQSCSSLETVVLSSCISPEAIGRLAFDDCPRLTAFQVEAGSQAGDSHLSAVDGVLFNEDQTVLFLYPTGKTESSYSVPATVTEIKDYAFCNCTNLTKVDLPASLKTIGDSAFASYIAADSDFDAFQSANLTEVDLSGCTSLETIGDSAFCNCAKLTEVDLSGCISLETIGEKAFASYISGLSDAFQSANLTKVDLSGCASLETIGDFAFYNCARLTSVDLSGCTSLETIGDSAFASYIFIKENDDTDAHLTSSDLESVNLPDSLKTIGDAAFENCGKLTSMDLSGCTGLTSIEGNTFKNCAALTKVNLPASLETIGEKAFENCAALTKVNLPASLETIGDYAFFSSGLTSVNLRDCTGLTAIGNRVFSGARLQTVDLHDCTNLTAIGDDAFSGCGDLTSVNLSGCTNLETIGDYAFHYCESLETVDLSGCTNLTAIEGYAFNKCVKLETVDLRGCTSLKTIGHSTFYNCASLTEVDLSGCISLETIRDSAFDSYILIQEDEETAPQPTSSDLASVKLPASLKTIGEKAFNNCQRLKELVVLAETPPTLGANALAGSSSACVIAVPARCVAAYKAADGWSSFADQIRGLPCTLTVAPGSDSQELSQGERPTAVTFTVTRGTDAPGDISFSLPTSSLRITLTGPNSDFFVLDRGAMAPTLASGGATTFTVTLQPDLAPGTYETTIQLESGFLTEPITATLTCTVKAVGIEASPASLDFGSAYTGYDQPSAQTVTVTNRSATTVTLTQPTDSASFTVGALSVTVLAPGETATFTVQPKAGLDVGTYRDTLQISGTYGVTDTYHVTDEVTLDFAVEIAPVYAISAAPEALDFGTVTVGYARAPAAKEVTVTNTGNQPVPVALPTSECYTVTAGAGFQDGEAVLAPGGKATFSVQPKTGLSTGTCSELLHITGSNGASADVALRFEVTRKPTYAVTVQETTGGTVTVSHQSAAKGRTVTITATPEAGYALECLTVTDKNGSALKLTALGGGKYSFEMPASQVTVRAVFSREALPFADVKPTDWFYDAVAYVYEAGLMDGVGSSRFAPNASTTRAMIVTILWRLEGEPEADCAMTFEDVADNTWYTEAVRWAASEGIVEGYSKTAFGPNDPITREQLAAILYRYAKYLGVDVSVGEDTNILSYTDAEEISEYAIPAIQWACGTGLLQGSSGALTPKGNATRAQVATMLMRWMERA